MMNVGTDVLRHHFNYDLWVFNVERRLAILNGSAVLIDARFPNEIRLARQQGGRVIRIQRGPEPVWMGTAMIANGSDLSRRDQAVNLLAQRGVHASEYAWIGAEVDATISNDGTVADLYAKVIACCL